MKISSFGVISLFSIVLGTVIISPQLRFRVSDTQLAEPQIQLEIADSSSVQAATAAVPVQLTIPSIALSSPIVPVGTNEKGEMDVPSGDTNNVGWYEPGVIPGESGSAVIDAHVFAAFKNLNQLGVGDEVFVEAEDGKRLRFVVTATRVDSLQNLSSDMLFQKTAGRQLNLITCAGKLTADRSTYDKRLIVYTQLAE